MIRLRSLIGEVLREPRTLVAVGVALSLILSPGCTREIRQAPPELEARERALEEREHALETRERALEARERALEERAHALEAMLAELPPLRRQEMEAAPVRAERSEMEAARVGAGRSEEELQELLQERELLWQELLQERELLWQEVMRLRQELESLPGDPTTPPAPFN